MDRRSLIESLPNSFSKLKVVVSGGLTRNDLYMQLHSDILGCEITSMKTEDADMMLVGKWSCCRIGRRKTGSPNRSLTKTCPQTRYLNSRASSSQEQQFEIGELEGHRIRRHHLPDLHTGEAVQRVSRSVQRASIFFYPKFDCPNRLQPRPTGTTRRSTGATEN